MNSSVSRTSRLAWPLILILALSLFAIFARFRWPLTRSWLETSELSLIDSRFRLRGPREKVEMDRVASKVAVVAMDGNALARFRSPFPRGVHARLVRQLKKAGAKAIVFDVLFVDPSKDAEFAAAIKDAGNVFLPFDDNAVDETDAATRRNLSSKLALPLELPSSTATMRIDAPVPALFNAMRGGGHVATSSDIDAKFRSAILFMENGAAFPHLALDAVAQTEWNAKKSDFRFDGSFLRVQTASGERLIGPLQKRNLARTVQDAEGNTRPERAGFGWMIPLDFAGGRDVMTRLSIPYLDALEGRADKRIKGRIVIIGETAQGTTDLRPSPFDTSETFLGVQTNATLIANLLDNDFLKPASSTLNFALVLLAGALAGTLALAFRPSISLPLAFATIILIGGISATAFSLGNIVLETTAPLVAVLGCYTALTAYRLTSTDRAERASRLALLETQTLLGQIVNPKLAQELANSPAKRLDLQIGARREVSVLFCDIRGFTPWSETQTPEEVKSRLDEYFPLMCEICEDDFEGFIDKFIGDAIMVLWNAHHDQPDHAERAVSAALSMQRGLETLNAGWAKQSVSPFQIGIGIASGDAIWGTFGARGRKVAPTVLGDTVNLAARLESLSKEHGPIVVSQNTRDALGEEFQVRFAGTVAIKGKSEAQSIYVVEGKGVSSTKDLAAQTAR